MSAASCASAERLEGLLPEEQVHIVAGADQRDEAEKAFGVMGDRFIAEPEGAIRRRASGWLVSGWCTAPFGDGRDLAGRPLDHR